jgi:hypothetical protein
VFAYRRTPFIAVIFAAVIGAVVIWLVEVPGRPMTLVQRALFFALSYLPGLGLAMLGDPAPRTLRAELLKIDFYAPGMHSRGSEIVKGGKA